jgi:hypothetical protein
VCVCLHVCGMPSLDKIHTLRCHTHREVRGQAAQKPLCIPTSKRQRTVARPLCSPLCLIHYILPSMRQRAVERLPLSFTHRLSQTVVQTHPFTPTVIHTLSFTQSHSNTPIRTRTPIYTRTPIHTPSFTHRHSHTPIYTPSFTHSHSHAPIHTRRPIHTHPFTHPHSHTVIHTPSLTHRLSQTAIQTHPFTHTLIHTLAACSTTPGSLPFTPSPLTHAPHTP